LFDQALAYLARHGNEPLPSEDLEDVVAMAQ
jgi:hypothetical protein